MNTQGLGLTGYSVNRIRFSRDPGTDSPGEFLYSFLFSNAIQSSYPDRVNSLPDRAVSDLKYPRLTSVKAGKSNIIVFEYKPRRRSNDDRNFTERVGGGTGYPHIETAVHRTRDLI